MSDLKVGFLITAYDQIREVSFTLDMLRNKWKRSKDSPIVVVISGDPSRTIKSEDVSKTRIVNLDDMVGKDFNGKVSSSIMKQIQHGVIEMNSLEGDGGVDIIVHFHGDILFLNEDGFYKEIEKFSATNKFIACDTVGPQNTDYISFRGNEIMPHVFAVKRHDPILTIGGFMHHMSIQGDLEKRSTEWALKENLRRAIADLNDFPAHEELPDHMIEDVYHLITQHRPTQWGLHKTWGGWCHFGNSIHFSKEVREARNEAALRAYGIDLSKW